MQTVCNISSVILKIKYLKRKEIRVFTSTHGDIIHVIASDVLLHLYLLNVKQG